MRVFDLDQRTGSLINQMARVTLAGVVVGAWLVASAVGAGAENEVNAGDGGAATVTGTDGGSFVAAPVEEVSTEITASNSLVVADASGGNGNVSHTAK